MKQVSPLISGVLIAVIFWMLDSIMLGYTLTNPTITGVLFTKVPIIRLSYRLMFLLICVLVGGYKSYRRIMNFDSIFDHEEKKNVRDSIRDKYLKRAKVETIRIGHKTVERLCTAEDAKIENINKTKPKKMQSLLLNNASERNRQVWEYCSVIGVKIGLSMRDISKLNALCYCHDMGHFGDNEAEHIKLGVKIAEEIPEYRRLAFAIKFHHERYDGKGPYGLKGKRIPVICRVFAIADKFYDLIDPAGEYKMDRKKALANLMDYSGTLLDPELVFAFISTMDKAKSTVNDLLTDHMGDVMTDGMKRKIQNDKGVLN
ncbi:MAG: HD-GYP domain-containing protein [Bacillota bacterium]|jgi:HD-GYP domain-containing protein (c-di-GMP phosphodiesterase class II)